jgi:hypothetical protein
VKAPGPDTGFAERCAELCPGFRAGAAVRRARKSALLAGDLDGMPVIAKRLLQPNEVWDWYFAREIAIYRMFAAKPPPFRVPRVYAAADDVLVIERLPVAFATSRRPYATPSRAMLAALLAYRERIAAWPGRFPDDAPPPRVRTQMRQRLLEDPTDVAWVREGLVKCGERGLQEGFIGAAVEALAADPRVGPAHGDLLLRNAMSADGNVVLVDWECAGTHPADWDLALLWTQLATDGRATVEAHVGDGPRLGAFLALVMFALCREVVFVDAFRAPAEHAGRQRIHDELAEVAQRLA